jgi:branched-subunit amino acid aminotransferase/4-amino-4-deoxychorismate lyase
MRRYLMTQTPLGMPIRETRLRPDDLESMDGCFLTNALIGVWPIAEIQLPTGPLRLPDVTMGNRIYQTLVTELGFAAR